MPVKLNELERSLSSLEKLKSPSPGLEQYWTPAPLAASIVYDAALRGDVQGRRVADLGCGIGTFVIAAMLLGAERGDGFDIDPASVEVASRNALRTLTADRLASTSFTVEDVSEVTGSYDTVFQNPPFGSQRRNADLPFLRKAIEIGESIYTMHLATTREFMKRKIEEYGGRVEFEKAFTYEMPWMFAFHTKESRFFKLILFKVVKIHS